MKKPNVSVIICCYNEEAFINECIKSILSQTYKHFELIIVNDGSTDNTEKKIKKLKDTRIKYFKNSQNKGIVYSKNKAISKAKGDFIFFTDADCVVEEKWIEKGLKLFKKNIVIVEGILRSKKTITLSDKIPCSGKKNLFLTGNVAYRTNALKKTGSFKLEYEGLEDREIALRLLKYGKCAYSNSIVIHQQKKHNIKSYISEAKRVIPKIKLIKEYRDKAGVKFNILYISSFLVLLFPFLLLIPIFQKRVRTFKDVCFIPLLYLRSIYMRYLIWKTAFHEKIFIL